MKVNNFSETTTADKVQVGDSTAGTTTGTNYTWTYNPSHSAEKGWECPRCRRINAPWVRQCDCNGNNWTITSDWTYKPEWWKEITCNPDTFRIHPESDPIWKAPSSTCGTDSATIAKSDPNIVHTYVTGTSDDSQWNQYITLTNKLDKIKYEIEELKETK